MRVMMTDSTHLLQIRPFQDRHLAVSNRGYYDEIPQDGDLPTTIVDRLHLAGEDNHTTQMSSA